MKILNLSYERLTQIVKGFKGKRVVVLGDLMLDKYIWGSVSRISPEAPVPVVEVVRGTSCLGGAGNVCHNLETLGAEPLLVGVIGDDEEGSWIKRNLKNGRGVFIDGKRPTTVKMRIIAHHQQVVRVDKEKKQPISAEMERKIVSFLKREKYEGIIISDYNKGIVTPRLMEKVLAWAKDGGIPIFVDPKVENIAMFSPVTLITPNHHEAEKMVRFECRTNEAVERAGKEILARIGTQYLIIKRGEEGMTVFEKGKRAVHIPTIAKEVFDVTGAGDTVIAVAAVALLAGATILEAAALANAAAGIVVGKIGTATVTADELLSSFKNKKGTFLFSQGKRRENSP